MFCSPALAHWTHPSPFPVSEISVHHNDARRHRSTPEKKSFFSESKLFAPSHTFKRFQFNQCNLQLQSKWAKVDMWSICAQALNLQGPKHGTPGLLLLLVRTAQSCLSLWACLRLIWDWLLIQSHQTRNTSRDETIRGYHCLIFKQHWPIAEWSFLAIEAPQLRVLEDWIVLSEFLEISLTRSNGFQQISSICIVLTKNQDMSLQQYLTHFYLLEPCRCALVIASCACEQVDIVGKSARYQIVWLRCSETPDAGKQFSVIDFLGLPWSNLFKKTLPQCLTLQCVSLKA